MKNIKNNVDSQYFKLVKSILKNGYKKEDRTGTGTMSTFGYDMSFDMRDGFPLLTSKKMFTKGIIHELIWFLKGDTNIKYLLDNNVHIWDGDCYQNYVNKTSEPLSKTDFFEKMSDGKFCDQWGNLGPIYGKQWRNWDNFDKRKISGPGLVSEVDSIVSSQIDQIGDLVRLIRSSPDSRRLIVTAWNPGDIPKSVLPPCHYGFQCWTREMSHDERVKWAIDMKIIDKNRDLSISKLDFLRVPRRYLSLKWIQRSVDTGLGLPFNIASYGILLHLLSREVNMVPLDLKFSGGDCHIYLNHIDSLELQLKQKTFKLPKLDLTNRSLDNISYEDIKIVDYKSSDPISMSLSN